MGVEQLGGSALLRRKHIFWGVLVGVAVLVVLAFLFRERIAEAIDFLMRIQSRKDRFRAWLDSFGTAGPLVFIAVQIFQVVFSPIPGELTGFVGGYIYGAWLATIYSTVGLSIGSWFAFLLGRWLGRPFVEWLIPRKVLKKFNFFGTRGGGILAFVLFAVPGFPKDYLCYLLGLSPLRTTSFLFVATVGRIPGTIMLGLQGANLYEEKYGLFFGLLIGFLVVGAAAAFFSEPIRLWLRAKAKVWGKPRPLSSERLRGRS